MCARTHVQTSRFNAGKSNPYIISAEKLESEFKLSNSNAAVLRMSWNLLQGLKCGPETSTYSELSMLLTVHFLTRGVMSLHPTLLCFEAFLGSLWEAHSHRK